LGILIRSNNETQVCEKALLLVCGTLVADPVLHKFELWGIGNSKAQKLSPVLGLDKRISSGKRGGRPGIVNVFGSYDGPIKRWPWWINTTRNIQRDGHGPLGEQLLEAVTISGGPCEGKNVWR
jgi:hypothetical protein